MKEVSMYKLRGTIFHIVPRHVMWTFYVLRTKDEDLQTIDKCNKDQRLCVGFHHSLIN